MPRQRLSGRVGASLHLWVPLDLAEEADKLGMGWETLKNMDKVVAEMLKTHEDKESMAKLHLFIDFLEAGRRMLEAENKLAAIRMQKYSRQPCKKTLKN